MIKRLLIFAALLIPAMAGAQQLVNCEGTYPSTNTACTPTLGAQPGGDPSWLAFGKINADFLALPSGLFASPSLIAGTNVTISGTFPNQTINSTGAGGGGNTVGSGAIVSGHCVQWTAAFTVVDSGATCGSGGASAAFSALTSSTNVTAAMVVGTGASLGASGSGTITANALSSAIALGTPASGTLTNETGLPISTGVSGLGAGVATFLATPSSANLAATVTGETGTGALVFGTSPSIATPTITGSTTLAYITGSTQCVHASATGVLSGTGSDCGAGGGSSAFSALTSSTNTTAAMVVGSGASLAPTGSGTIGATTLSVLSGLPAIATQTVLGNGSGSTVAPVALTLSGNLVATASGLATSQPINPQVGTSYALLTTDAGKLVTFANAAAVAVSLSQATTTGFTAGYSFDIENKGAGTVTVTPATSTINGGATLAIATNQGCTVTSDGTNYQVSACTAISGGGGSSAFSSITGGTNTTAAMILGTGSSLAASGSGTIAATSVLFNGIGTGTNSTATLTMGTGGTLTVSGTGVNNANQVNAAVVPTSAAVLSSNSSKQLVAATTVTYLVDAGTIFTVAGTGACATITTQTGGTSTGRFTCTGTTGASTFTITLPASVNGWECVADDKTTTANAQTRGADTTTSFAFSGTVNANDVIRFMCIGS